MRGSECGVWSGSEVSGKRAVGQSPRRPGSTFLICQVWSMADPSKVLYRLPDETIEEIKISPGGIRSQLLRSDLRPEIRSPPPERIATARRVHPLRLSHACLLISIHSSPLAAHRSPRSTHRSLLTLAAHHSLTPLLSTPLLITPLLITPLLITPLLITPLLTTPLLITPLLNVAGIMLIMQKRQDGLLPLLV